MVTIDGRTRDIRQINVTSSCVAVPAKHGIDRSRQFGMVSLINTTGVDPKVHQAILSSLFSTEQDLLIASLILTTAICHVLEGNFLVVRSPCVRKYSIWWNFVAEILQAELAIAIDFKKSHN